MFEQNDTELWASCVCDVILIGIVCIVAASYLIMDQICILIAAVMLTGLITGYSVLLSLLDVQCTLIVTAVVIGITVATNLVYCILYLQGFRRKGIKARTYAARLMAIEVGNNHRREAPLSGPCAIRQAVTQRGMCVSNKKVVYMFGASWGAYLCTFCVHHIMAW